MRLLLTASLLAGARLSSIAQEPAAASIPAAILKPLADEWPTYSGDYTGRRFSALTQINQTTVKSLSLAWVARLTRGRPTRRRRRAAAAAADSAVAAAARR